MNAAQFNLAASRTRIGARLLDCARGVLVDGEPVSTSMWRAGVTVTASTASQVRRAVAVVRAKHRGGRVKSRSTAHSKRAPDGWRTVKLRIPPDAEVRAMLAALRARIDQVKRGR